MFKNEFQMDVFTYDFSADNSAGATGTRDLSDGRDLPTGAVVYDVLVDVETALAGSGASAKIGTSAADASYAADAAIATYSDNALINTFDRTPVKVTGATGADVVLTISGAALTAGKLHVTRLWYRNE